MSNTRLASRIMGWNTSWNYDNSLCGISEYNGSLRKTKAKVPFYQLFWNEHGYDSQVHPDESVEYVILYRKYDCVEEYFIPAKNNARVADRVEYEVAKRAMIHMCQKAHYEIKR